MRNRFTARFMNGVISAIIVAFFLAHGTMGALMPFTGLSGPPKWLVWLGMSLVGVHVITSLVTSVQQLTDKERPPSVRKKRHLALKWLTGSILALAIAAHIVFPKSTSTATLVIVLLSVALAVHLCVGSKSLLTDLSLNKRHKAAFRIVVLVFSALFITATVIGVFHA